MAHLNQFLGMNGIPLYYVIRDPELEMTYRTENGVIGEKIYDAEHRGRAYEQDSFRVMHILRRWTSGGTTETYPDKTETCKMHGMRWCRSLKGSMRKVRRFNEQERRYAQRTGAGIHNILNLQTTVQNISRQIMI